MPSTTAPLNQTPEAQAEDPPLLARTFVRSLCRKKKRRGFAEESASQQPVQDSPAKTRNTR